MSNGIFKYVQINMKHLLYSDDVLVYLFLLQKRLTLVLLIYFYTTLPSVQIRKFYERKIVIISLSIYLIMCFGCSKELSH